nr:response regulator transcription factor [uncultured Eisenbergiella sp.]
MNTIYDSSLLLVDDNEELCRMLTDMLYREGFRNVDSAGSCEEAFLSFRAGKKEPDLVILDINLPDGDGFSLMQRIRMVSMVPVLFLSARDEDNDRLLGLGLGADDYMTKPFLPRELLLRLTAILKRTYFPPGRPGQQGETGILQLGKKKVDFNAGTVTEGKESLQLTAKELAILKKLYENRGNIVTFDILCNTVWGDEYYGYENTLMVHIRRLREKIEENPSAPEWLLTVRGLGYRLAKEH